MLPHPIVSDNMGVIRGTGWEEMLDAKSQKTFFNSVHCGVSFWSEECECSSWGGENHVIPVLLAKPKMKGKKKKKKNVLMVDSSCESGTRGLGLQVHRPRSVFSCNEDDGDFLIQSSAVRRINDAHLQLVNRHRLVCSDSKI